MSATELNILVFGQLVEITGQERLVVPSVGDTAALQDALIQQFPRLAGSRYVIAVNKEICATGTEIPAGANIALLPPFSGG